MYPDSSRVSRPRRRIRVKEPQRKVKELRRAKEILRLASAFFARAEFSRRLK